MLITIEDSYKDLISFFDNPDIISEEFKQFLVNKGYFVSPASTKYHGNYDGGLYAHSRAVCKRLVELTKANNLKWSRPESPAIIGMFHDLCKYDCYKPVTVDGRRAYEYNTDTVLKGHGAKSVMLLTRFMTLTEEEVLCIRYHMGAYEKEEWTEFDKAIHMYPNVLWTHMADMLASKVDDI